MTPTGPRAAEVAAHWPVGSVAALTPLGDGNINAAWRVQAASGAFHLRVYRDPRRERAEVEHRAERLARTCSSRVGAARWPSWGTAGRRCSRSRPAPRYRVPR